jgi:hypothetical protein
MKAKIVHIDFNKITNEKKDYHINIYVNHQLPTLETYYHYNYLIYFREL